MAEVIKVSAGKDRATLGKTLMSWVHKPKVSPTWILLAVGVIGALVLFLIMYGERLLPWLDNIPDVAYYVLFLLLGPALNFIKSIGKDQEWTLYERGFSVRYMNKGQGTGDEKFGYWGDYKSCTYDSSGVKLISDSPVKKNLKMHVPVNVMEVYSICRERISVAQSEKLHSGREAPSAPKTAEQKRMSKLERQMSQRESKISDWSDLFKS